MAKSRMTNDEYDLYINDYFCDNFIVYVLMLRFSLGQTPAGPGLRAARLADFKKEHLSSVKPCDKSSRHGNLDIVKNRG